MNVGHLIVEMRGFQVNAGLRIAPSCTAKHTVRDCHLYPGHDTDALSQIPVHGAVSHGNVPAGNAPVIPGRTDV